MVFSLEDVACCIQSNLCLGLLYISIHVTETRQTLNLVRQGRKESENGTYELLPIISRILNFERNSIKVSNMCTYSDMF